LAQARFRGLPEILRRRISDSKKKRRNVRRLGTFVPKFGTSDGEQSRIFEMFITMFGRKVAFWDKG
jgi:hypothetical protein